MLVQSKQTIEKRKLITFLKEHRLLRPRWIIVYALTAALLTSIMIPSRMNYWVKIRLLTSSDWTTLRNANWHDATLISSSENVISAVVQSGQLHLVQSIDSANKGNIIEMEAKVAFSNSCLLIDFFRYVSPSFGQWLSQANEVFEIERGNIGWTHVQLSQLISLNTTRIENFWFTGIQPTVNNIKHFKLAGSTIYQSRLSFDTHPEDASTLSGKAIPGYQGWFSCPGDGSDFNAWIHWFRNNTPTLENLNVDYWPDIRELEDDEKFATQLNLPNGEPAQVFSSYVQKTVVRHFAWMKQYNIPGVFVQRFIAGMNDPRVFGFCNKVLQNAQLGAERNGRVFAIMYDISDAIAANTNIRKDWEFLSEVLKITESPNYLHHKGKPVVALWGPGFIDRYYAATTAKELILWFKNTAGVTIVGGVPAGWRTLDSDSRGGEAWREVYSLYDVLSPWSVGRYNDLSSMATFYSTRVEPDIHQLSGSGVEYMPVVWPGFSWHNMDENSQSNLIPRNGGIFFNTQWTKIRSMDEISMVYIAMFDEVDEGTAIFKLAESESMLPVGADLVPLDAEGYATPSDLYLMMAGDFTTLLRSR